MAYIGRDIQYGVLDKQTLTGANGVKTQWTDLTYGVGSASSLLVSVGGVIQEPDVAYTASGNVLNFTEAPETGDTVFVVYLGKELSVATAQSDLAYQTGTGDGTTTPITTMNRSVPAAEDIMVMLNGVTQVPGTDYNVSGTTLTFTSAVASGVNILVYFLGIAANIGTPSDGTVTTAKLVADSVTDTILADHASLDANRAVGTNHIKDANVTDAKLATSGTMPAWDGSALQNLPAGGGERNYIIDGGLTQWPEGNKTSLVNGHYTSALLKYQKSGAVVWDATQTTDSDNYGAIQLDNTTAATSIAASDYSALIYTITGVDYRELHGQEVTLRFKHKHTKTGIHSVGFRNPAGTRGYVAEYTQSVADTEETAEVTLTLDTTGTWLFTETDRGLEIWFPQHAGSSFTMTAGSWASSSAFASTNQVNNSDSNSNNFIISQLGLYHSSSAPDSFIAEPIATVKDQVDWYVQRYDFNTGNGEHTGISGYQFSTTQSVFSWNFRRPFRSSPSLTGSNMNTFGVLYRNSSTVVGNSSSFSSQFPGKYGARIYIQHSAVGASSDGVLLRRNGSSTTFLLADARH